MKRSLSFIVYFLIFISFLFAQQSKIDSLESLLSIAKKDSNYVLLLGHLSEKYESVNPKKSLEYAERMIELSKKINFSKGLANGYNAKGVFYDYTGEYNKALENYFKAYEIREKTGNKNAAAMSLTNIASIYMVQKDYDKAMECYTQTLKLFEELGVKKSAAIVLNNIGNIYYHLAKYDQALEYYFKSLKIKEELNQKKGIIYTLNNIGEIYFEQKNYERALEYQHQSLKIAEEIGDEYGMAVTFGNLSDIYQSLGDGNNLKLALQYADKCLMISRKSAFKEKIETAYKNFSGIYADLKNYRKAYEYHQLYSQMKDSLFNEESSKQITEMQTKYETEKKEKEIQLLNKDKEIQDKDLQRQKTIRNAVAGGLLLVLLFSFVLINRLFLIRKQKKLIEIEREKSEKLLLNILPKEIAEELKRNNKVVTRQYEMITVMFTDFKGFTTIAEKMSAEELVSELDFIFKKFDEIISKYPIEKIKTIGDAYMCAGGVPVANTTNPMDVVMVGLEICEFMKSRQVAVAVGSKEKGLPLPSAAANWQIRIGIHTGSVIAGVVGDKKFAYDIWGDAVNIASRMESSGEAGKVNISGTTYELVKEKFRCIYRGEIEAKNKGKIKMYFVDKK